MILILLFKNDIINDYIIILYLNEIMILLMAISLLLKRDN